MASLHVIRDELAPMKDEIPDKVYAELSAMETYLKREWEDSPRLK